MTLFTLCELPWGPRVYKHGLRLQRKPTALTAAPRRSFTIQPSLSVSNHRLAAANRIWQERSSPTIDRAAGAKELRRYFHATNPRRDVFFVSVPVFKSIVLEITRISLVTLPFLYRYKLFRRFPKAARMFLRIPVIAFAVIVALGISQSPTTHRWRLCLMTQREEIQWSQKRFATVMADAHDSVLPATDPRADFIKKIAEKLVTDIATADEHYIASPLLTPTARARHVVPPTARIHPQKMPFRPASSNPLKIVEPQDWDIFILDQPELNAFVLPTKEIFITTGLIDLIKHDEGLIAAALSHELAHVSERHAVENLGFLALSSVAFDIVRGITYALTVSFPYVTDSLNSAFNFLDKTVTERAYSRKLEIEADQISLHILAKAGIDPTKARELWAILSELEAEEKAARENDHKRLFFDLKGCPLLSTHPPAEERFKAIEKDLPASLAEYHNLQKQAKI